MARICVVLASYNGSKYIAEQIESIENCLGRQDELIIFDDCSTDDTFSICKTFEGKYRNIKAIENRTNKGVAHNFLDAISNPMVAAADYIALSDQDDVWMSDKLDRAIRFIEGSDFSSAAPILYYSNAENYNEQLDTLLYDVCPANLGKAIAEDFVTAYFYSRALGCTYVLNSALAHLIGCAETNDLSFPRLHDGWIHSAAMLCGHVIFDYEYAGIKRRVSSQNFTAPTNGIVGKYREWKRSSNKPFTKEAAELQKAYSDRLDSEGTQFVANLIATNDNLASRIQFARAYKPCCDLSRQLRFKAKVLGGRL